ncbi:MAG TPA: MBL fold metallo-hydrolase [Capsulimonadaceae bacterium]|jgi:glyoxylase-like metal-dependent hydrolase (beta-lactamase superfamily II)
MVAIERELTQLLPHLWRYQSQLSCPHHPAVSYIWLSQNSIILIDPVSDLKPSTLPVGSRVSDILVTHLQDEHVVGVHHYPEARFHVPLGDEYLCDGIGAYRRKLTAWPAPWDWETRGNFQGHIAGAPNERPMARPRPPDALLIPGTKSCGVDVVATPGHGKSAVSLLAEIDGKLVAFSGDLVYDGGRLWNWFDSEWDYGLQTGHHALANSANRLRSCNPDLLCPAHGPTVTYPDRALAGLSERLTEILQSSAAPATTASINFPELDSAPGFREITPHLHQYRDGNCNALLSDTGAALLVDDGLCYWHEVGDRKAHHDRVISELKHALNISRVEIVIPTHYHGDHTENIPDIVETDAAKVLCLDLIAMAVEQGEKLGLACPLSWYGANYDTVDIDRLVSARTVITWREYELEIFHLGGQTYHHLGIDVVVDGLRTLFVGDATANNSAVGDPVICYNDAEPYQRGWAFSLQRMQERNPDLLVCGHGSAIKDPAKHISVRIDYWEKVRSLYESISARDNLRAFFDPFAGH